MDKLELEYGPEMIEWTTNEDEARMQKARACRGEEYYQQRKQKKLSKAAHNARMKKLNGIQYGAGLF